MQQIASDLFDAIPDGRRGRLRRHRRRAAPDDHDRADARCSDRAPRRLPAVVRLLHRDVGEDAFGDDTRTWTATSPTSSSSASTSPSSSRTGWRTRATTCSRSWPRPSGKAKPLELRGAAVDGADPPDRRQRDDARPARGRRSGAWPSTPTSVAILVGVARARCPAAVEEFLRYVTPVTHMCRTALDDVELRGPADPPRRLPVPALRRRRTATRTIWERADELDVTRATPTRRTLAFGFAEHFCLGASLARRESADRADRAAGAVPQLRAGRRRRLARDSHMTPGIKRMPVVFRR